jgi:hypothetical protein
MNVPCIWFVFKKKLTPLVFGRFRIASPPPPPLPLYYARLLMWFGFVTFL